MKKFYRYISIILFALMLSSCQQPESTSDIPAVKNFQLDKYLGRWHEIARLPFRFENGMSDVTADYTMGENGTVLVENSGIKKGKRITSRGVAKFKNSPDTGELEVSFFRPFYGDYRIIYLDRDYTLSAVTSSRRDKLWILARVENPPPEKITDLVEQLKTLRFDTDKLIYNTAD